MPAIIRPAYERFDAFYQRWQSLVGLFLGACVIGISVYLVTVAVALGTAHEHEVAQRNRERTAHVKEARTVKVACERSRQFGPPFITFLTQTSEKLSIDSLYQNITVNGKPTNVLAFYRSTIPKSCPTK